ncbi:MAG: hypothetical protein KDD70_11705 [Bdellovibrionales bacterium]|nr:hypothetical protein [Bdellovibrionales bacterium]
MLNVQQTSFAFHILGLIFWLGGLIALSRVLRVFTKRKSSEESVVSSSSDEVQGSSPQCSGKQSSDKQCYGKDDLVKACQSLWYGFVLGGLAIVVVTGTIQLLAVGVGYYMKQGWFHTKLTAVLVLIGVTVFTGLQMMKLGRGEALKRGSLAMIHGATSGLALIILLVTYLGRAIS